MKNWHLLLKLSLIFFASAIYGKVISQSIGDYQSFNSGTWSVAANWSRWDGASWVNPAPAAPSSSDGVITILSGNTMTIAGVVSIDQVVINSGGQLTINSGFTTTLANGTGVDLDCSGTILNSGTVTWTGTMSIQSSGTYIHNTTGSSTTAFAAATLNSGSTWIYRGSSTLTPSATFSGRTYDNLSFDVSSGSYTITMSGGSALTVNGNFTVGSGVTLSNTMTGTNVFAGNYTNNGTISNGAGTQIYSFTGSGKTIGGSGTIAFETLSNSASASTTLGVNISIASTFTGTINGILDCGSNVISGAGSFTLASGATIKTSNATGVAGSITVSGTKTFSSGANYEFQGAATGSFTTSPSANTVNNLTINNTGGNVTLSSTLTAAGTTTFTAGKLVLGSNSLTITTLSGPAFGSDVTSYAVVEGAGRVSRSISSSTLFPVGTSGVYMPVRLTGSGTYGVKITATASGLDFPAQAMTSMWDMTGSGAVDMDCQWKSAVQGGSFPGLGAVNIFKYTTPANVWSNEGSGTSTEPNADVFNASFTSVPCCSGFVVGASTALPIELRAFAVKKSGNVDILDWQTATETNNSHFAIERSADARVFSEIGQVRGAGTTQEPQSYTFTDERPLAGINYYRLRQVDYDGTESFSPVVSVVFGKQDRITLAPSPATDLVRIHLEDAFRTDGLWQVYDNTGRQVLSGAWEAETADYELDVNTLPEGMYTFRLVVGASVQVKQFRKL